MHKEISPRVQKQALDSEIKNEKQTASTFISTSEDVETIKGAEPLKGQQEVGKIQYIEIIDSCGPYFDGICVNARPTPGTDINRVSSLRNGMVLRADGLISGDKHDWYKVNLDEPIRYTDRITTDWHVAADYAKSFRGEGVELLTNPVASTTKKIIVDLSEQKLYAWSGERLFMEEYVSTGVPDTPTPRGTFTIFKKTPSRYMQGPIPGISEKFFDLPGVPWNLYFTEQGAIIHGTYWHNKFGEVHSNGCVNLPVDKAKKLYAWADLGTPVYVVD